MNKLDPPAGKQRPVLQSRICGFGWNFWLHAGSCSTATMVHLKNYLHRNIRWTANLLDANLCSTGGSLRSVRIFPEWPLTGLQLKVWAIKLSRIEKGKCAHSLRYKGCWTQRINNFTNLEKPIKAPTAAKLSMIAIGQMLITTILLMFTCWLLHGINRGWLTDW